MVLISRTTRAARRGTARTGPGASRGSARAWLVLPQELGDRAVGLGGGVRRAALGRRLRVVERFLDRVLDRGLHRVPIQMVRREARELELPDHDLLPGPRAVEPRC